MQTLYYNFCTNTREIFAISHLPDALLSPILLFHLIPISAVGIAFGYTYKKTNNIYMNYGYIRVSTDKQTVENQRYEITDFAQKNGIQIDEWIEELIGKNSRIGGK